jgi:bifunctional NMN adenylyltransferase/nudix hydrolase
MDYPTSFQTVDAVIWNHFTGEILLGKKEKDGELWRLPGGFIDPSDVSLESGVLREISEECPGIQVAYPLYLFSHRQDDERYRNSIHKILTAVFSLEYKAGVPKAGDDLKQVEWFPAHAFTNWFFENHIISEHINLFKILKAKGLIG